MRVELIPLLDDNYGYFLIDESSSNVLVIDPAEADKVMTAFAALQSKYSSQSKDTEQLKLNFHTILTTHRHWDHAGGNNAMLSLLKAADFNKDVAENEIRCYGGKLDNVEGCTHPVENGDEISIGNLKITCIHTPGHTNGHICYFVEDLSVNATGNNSSSSTNLGDDDNDAISRGVFTGDCLFAGGSGRFFEGTPADMYLSFERLGALPLDTKIYCGHEYTISNYRFATWLDETNLLLEEQYNTAKLQRENNQPTIPTTLKIELDTNPFFRTLQLRDRVCSILKERNDTILFDQEEKEERDINIEIMGHIREFKNNFK